MTAQDHPTGPSPPPDPDGRRALVARILESSGFQKSQRLRELLLYLCDQASHRTGRPVQEQEIGVAVFGRSPDYDTGNDTIVRSHVSLLRKKLQHYFETDGAAETLLLEIPKGGYSPVFLPRAGVAPGTATSRNPWGPRRER